MTSAPAGLPWPQPEAVHNPEIHVARIGPGSQKPQRVRVDGMELVDGGERVRGRRAGRWIHVRDLGKRDVGHALAGDGLGRSAHRGSEHAGKMRYDGYSRIGCPGGRAGPGVSGNGPDGDGKRDLAGCLLLGRSHDLDLRARDEARRTRLLKLRESVGERAAKEHAVQGQLAEPPTTNRDRRRAAVAWRNGTCPSRLRRW